MWAKAGLKDIDTLAQMFFDTLKEKPSYVSHGEMQMGIANEKGIILEGAQERWKDYIKKKIQNRSRQYPSKVLKYQRAGKIIAFGVFMVTDDDYHKFGIVCDMIVRKKFRKHGLGKQLLTQGVDWFHSIGIEEIYLESGLLNHSAHQFYKHQGFSPISYVFKLTNPKF